MFAFFLPLPLKLRFRVIKTVKISLEICHHHTSVTPPVSHNYFTPRMEVVSPTSYSHFAPILTLTDTQVLSHWRRVNFFLKAKLAKIFRLTAVCKKVIYVQQTSFREFRATDLLISLHRTI